MNQKPMRSRSALLLCGIAALGLAACGGSASGPELSDAKVIGTWEAPGEVTVVLEDGGRFSTNAVPASGALDRGGADREGNWKFTDTGNARHTGLELRFDIPAGGLEPYPIDLVSTEKDGKLSLCVYGEPDDPCSGYLLAKAAG
ncbi:hypothetical protein [Kitasatospora phosalacinea]|nr:hypothetical protein [Kitasatospora phosalacinea]